METNRDYLFDNIKGVLIFLVVFGHSIQRYTNQAQMLNLIYSFIYIFHMPLFFFISGFFYKNIEKSRDKAFNTLILPYIVFNTIYGLCICFIRNETFKLTIPYNEYWFLLSLFSMKIILPYLINIRYILIISFLVAFVAGFFKDIGLQLSISRTLSFMPFFVFGYYSQRDTIYFIRDKKYLLIITFLFICMALYVISNDSISRFCNFFQDSPYDHKLYGPVLRIFQDVCAISIFLGFFILMPKQKVRLLSYMGRNVMIIYALHVLIIGIIRLIIPTWNMSWLHNSIVLLSPLVIVLLLCHPFVVRSYDGLMNHFVGKLIYKPEVA